MLLRNLLQSFKCALKGLFYTLKTQRNMRIHIYLAAGVILAGILLDLTPIEIVVLCCVIVFVLITEIINTALEFSLDFVNNKRFNPSIKIVKDIVAAGVLIASINAVVVGCIIFLPHLNLSRNKPPEATEIRKPRNKWQDSRSALCFLEFNRPILKNKKI